MSLKKMKSFLTIVPGIAFDNDKNRIGFGKGYYDNFLVNAMRKKSALAYDFQVLKIYTE